MNTGKFVGAFVLVAGLALGGCHFGAHPDDQGAIYKALDQNNLRSVMVSQDRSSGVITLSGIVGSEARKQQAETLAKQAAPDYTISNQLRIDSNSVLGMANHPADKSQTADPKSAKK